MTQAVDTASAKPLVQNHSTTKKEKKKVEPIIQALRRLRQEDHKYEPVWATW
jgi:hypothetical protein